LPEIPTSEERERAKARALKLGSEPKLTNHQKREAIKRRDAGEPVLEIARTYNISHSTISRLTDCVPAFLMRHGGYHG
jgi:DNA invertase Pin-like site-specific DNA recombinase